MSKTAARLLKKLRGRPETKDLIRADQPISGVYINRGGHGLCCRWAIPLSGIMSDSCVSDVLRCTTKLDVFDMEDGTFAIEVPSREMRRLYPHRAEKGIYSDKETP